MVGFLCGSDCDIISLDAFAANSAQCDSGGGGGQCSRGKDLWETQQKKPHKAHDAAWAAIRSLRNKEGFVGLKHFKLLRRLGCGDIGNVFLCQLRGMGCYQYAMKVVNVDALRRRNKLQRAQAEINILGLLDHPFLPTLYAHFDASQYSCIVMDYCPGGDLHTLRHRQPGRRFSIRSARFYAAEVLLALEYLHMMGVIYRDLKPENVLVRQDGHIMLSDFDLSLKCDVVPTLSPHQTLPQLPQHAQQSHPQITDSDDAESDDEYNQSETAKCIPILQKTFGTFWAADKKNTKRKTILQRWCDKRRRKRGTSSSTLQCGGCNWRVQPLELVAEPTEIKSRSLVGTHEYLAPEVTSGEGHGSAVDWWTLGVFLYELLYGTTPFKGPTNHTTLRNIVSQPLRFPSACAQPAEAAARDLIEKLLVKDPLSRLGSKRGSADIKCHAFFKGVNWPLLRSTAPPEVPGLRRCRKTLAAQPLPQYFDYF